ncbi:MAG: helix-turn-helix transcriptional regulator [Candidatus Dormibacteraceae bacterium]
MSYRYEPESVNQGEDAQYSFALLIEQTAGGNADPLRWLQRAAPDVAIYPGEGRIRLVFDREGSGFGDCVLTAIREVESVPGLRVMHLDPDELVWASEIAERSGQDLTTINQMIANRAGPAYFPLPANPPSPTPLWRWAEVAEWFRRWAGVDLVDRQRTIWIEAINAVLAARHQLDVLPPDQRGKLADLLRTNWG